MKYAVFSKHLQAWPLDRACAEARAAGFDGLDLTVRDGGYVAPADVTHALPAAVRTAHSHGLAVPLLTTGLLSHDDPQAKPLLHAAADAGVPELKLHYWPLDPGQPPRPQIDAAKRCLSSLSRLAERTNVRINVHNHSGPHVQHAAWLVDELVRDLPPAHVGVYYDPAHYALEGGVSGWRAALDLLAPRVSLVAVKDFRWLPPAPPLPQDGAQERRWVPVGTGNVAWPEVFQRLTAAGFDAWLSIHGEYQGRWSFKDLDAPAVLAQCAADRRFIQTVVADLPKNPLDTVSRPGSFAEPVLQTTANDVSRPRTDPRRAPDGTHAGTSAGPTSERP